VLSRRHRERLIGGRRREDGRSQLYRVNGTRSEEGWTSDPERGEIIIIIERTISLLRLSIINTIYLYHRIPAGPSRTRIYTSLVCARGQLPKRRGRVPRETHSLCRPARACIVAVVVLIIIIIIIIKVFADAIVVFRTDETRTRTEAVESRRRPRAGCCGGNRKIIRARGTCPVVAHVPPAPSRFIRSVYIGRRSSELLLVHILVVVGREIPVGKKNPPRKNTLGREKRARSRVRSRFRIYAHA